MLAMQRGESVNVELLKELRIDRGLSQRRLSELAGVSNTTVWHIENGAAARPDTLKKLADVLGVRASELVR
jgi:transcriptional regulator with XRE-family HTH domain